MNILYTPMDKLYSIIRDYYGYSVASHVFVGLELVFGLVALWVLKALLRDIFYILHKMLKPKPQPPQPINWPYTERKVGKWISK